MKFSTALLFAAPFLARVLAEDGDDGEDAPVAIGTFANCPLYGDDYEPEIDMSSWTLSASGCATAASVVNNVVTYTSLVRRKVKNTYTGTHTYAYVEVSEYVEEMLENKKELLERTCEYCEDENFIAACENAGHDMGQDEEEEAQEDEAQEDEAQDGGDDADGRRLRAATNARRITTDQGIFTSFTSMCTNCQSLCNDDDDENDGSVNEHELMEAQIELIKELSGCQKIEQEDDEGDEDEQNDGDDAEEVEYYADILCTDSGFTVQVFEDEDCTVPSSDKTISDFTFVFENECAQAENEDGDEEQEEAEDGACNVALTPDLSILVDNTGIYCSETKQFEAIFGFLDGIVNVEEEDENDNNGDGNDEEEEEEEISRSCEELGKDSMFCPALVNGCAGISSDEYDICLHMETIGTSKSTIQVIGSGYLVNSDGDLVSKWGVSDGSATSGFTKLLLSIAVAGTAAFAVMSCFYHGKLSSGNKTNVALSGQGGHGV